MTLDLASLLPDGFPLLVALGFVILSFFTSALTATFGLGGGSLMIAVMALVLPPAVAVPVHGLVQLGSNAGRAAVMRRHVQWRFAAVFIAGSAVGATMGGWVASLLPEALFSFIIAAFIIWSAWTKLPAAPQRGPVFTAAVGAVTAAVGMVTGVAGPLVAAFLRFLPDRRQIIATHASLMTAQNLFKATAFAALGFSFAPYLPLVATMIASGFLGTLLGDRILASMPETAFRLGFKLLLTAIALLLVQSALF